MGIVCKNCQSKMINKSGFTNNQKQRYYCKNCKKRFILDYSYNAYQQNINNQIILLTKEGLGIRSTARVLEISPTTLLRRILDIASKITTPKITTGQTYQVDELRTYIKNKKNAIWIIYAIDAKTKLPVNLKVGKRNMKNLRVIIDTLFLSNAKKIHTDKLNIYKSLIDEKIHSTKLRGTNHIERKHLTLRTHLKRLNRRTICYSKSLLILSAILKIYFWG